MKLKRRLLAWPIKDDHHRSSQYRRIGAQGKLSGIWDRNNMHFKIGDAPPTPPTGIAWAAVAGKGLMALEVGKDLRRP
jgi:hypothetical protein